MKFARLRSKKVLALSVLIASLVVAQLPSSDAGVVVAQAVGTRDPWLRPFVSSSIWNMPLGSGARYVPANMPYTKNHGNTTVYLMKTKASDPLQPILKVGSWRDRCSGTGYQGTSVHLPDGWQPKPVTASSTPNNATVFLQPDGRTLVNVGTAARCDLTGPMHANRPGIENHITDLYGDGVKGAHGASKMSQLGGVIRPGELSGDKPIAHALNLLVWAKHLYWGGSRQASARWPATSSDSYAGPDTYAGSNPELKMGSLLAIAPGATPESVGVTTAVGRKLFDALQDYGAYITDDTAWDATRLSVDDAAMGTFSWGTAEKADMARMVMALNVISNNTAQSIGGGGTPRQPLLPPLPNEPPTESATTTAPATMTAPTTTAPTAPVTTVPSTKTVGGTITMEGTATAPTVSVTPGSTSMDVVWSHPSNSWLGQVRHRPEGARRWTWEDTVKKAGQLKLTGLAPATAYDIQVRIHINDAFQDWTTVRAST